MATFNTKSIALKWYFFMTSSFTVYMEFSHLFMKQLGFSPQQIGMTSLFGFQNLFIPLLLYAGDRFRARKLLIFIATIASAFAYLLSLLPLVVSLPTCFGGGPLQLVSNSSEMMSTTQATYRHSSVHSNDNNSVLLTRSVGSYQNVPLVSYLFLVMTVSRSFVTYFDGVVLSLTSLATTSYLGQDRAKYGAYYTWRHIGNSTSLVSTAVIAWAIKVSICGNEGYGYFASAIVAAILILFSMVSLPNFEFKYEADRTINWTEVKSVLFNGHYVYMYMLNFYVGMCVAFQVFWEFWYLDGLKAGPLVMGGAALIRRPFLAMTLYHSCYLIKKIGDIYTICVGFLLLALSFFCLSFTRVYWYVLAIDMVQAAGYGLCASSLTVHFSKAGSKAMSGVVFGIQQMCFMGGLDAGASIFGVLFQAIGTRITLLVYALTTGITLCILLFYVKSSKQVNEYEKVPDDSDDNDSSGQ